MKTNKAKYISILFFSLFLGFTGCTKQGIKNRALLLAVEKFDNEAQETAKANFVDQEQQKVFADFTKANTSIDADNVDLKSDTEATVRISIETFPKSVIEELKTISGKDWKAKVAATREKKSYTMKLQKIEGQWKMIEQVENPK